MVRFHWHVEDGLGACVGPGQLVYLRDHGVLQAMVEIEMPGQSQHLEACMNIPQNYNTDSGVKELGVIIAHGDDASDWRGRLLAELAVTLARAGFLVMRYISPHGASEAQRVVALEKAADVAATSPYARGVTRWVLAGLGTGARVAAAAGSRVRSGVAGYVFMSYPLKDEMPAMSEPSESQAGSNGADALAAAPDSSGPLLGLAAPMLFVTASTDPWITETALVELGPRMATSDVRSVVLQDVDSHFRTLTGKGPHAPVIRTITAAMHEFLNAANAYRMDFCKLPRIWRGSGSLGPAAGGEGDGATAKQASERPALQRPACFRPIPTGPPPQQQLQNQHSQHLQQQQQLLSGAHGGVGAAAAAALPYGLTATAAAQALAAQIQQRQAAAGAAGGGQSAAHLLTQQMLLQQAAAAAAVQRRASEHQDNGVATKLQQASAAATRAGTTAATPAAGGGGAATGANPLAAGLAQALSDPSTAAQLAVVLLRNQQQAMALGGQQPSAAGGGGGGTSLTEALTSALMQRLAAQQPGAAANPLLALQGGQAGQLLAATLLKQQQQQQQQQQLLHVQGAGGGGAAAAATAAAASSATQQQQLQQLLLQQRQQLALNLQQDPQQLGRQSSQQQTQQQALQSALLLQGNAAMLQAALRGPGGGVGTGSGLTPGGVLMLQAAQTGLMGTPFGGVAGRGADDADMADEDGS